MEKGYKLRGHHHEIYLSDPRRGKPENIKTIIRHPITKVKLIWVNVFPKFFYFTVNVVCSVSIIFKGTHNGNEKHSRVKEYTWSISQYSGEIFTRYEQRDRYPRRRTKGPRFKNHIIKDEGTDSNQQYDKLVEISGFYNKNSWKSTWDR